MENTYEDDLNTATELLDKWTSAIGKERREEVDELREDAEGFIRAWKFRHPKRNKDIKKYVQGYLESIFV